MDEALAGGLAVHRACYQAQAQAHESIIADQAVIIANLWTVLGWTGFKPEQVRSMVMWTSVSMLPASSSSTWLSATALLVLAVGLLACCLLLIVPDMQPTAAHC